ncbi:MULTISPECIES: hypothetical protein [unclassified Gordonia (in: high G+C Gram-positive bacteria)]|uniref:hypothetical protein n=1 Tax=unclassified Gordonia (in: high G+C Gram-positive bacteria) TaxID=2657482 RepID=UPI001FFF9105|nr:MULTISPECIES: hypothetical protein [unclassified Gordonia (in: high G+C Gram-positive bacteria)]UQE74327.1 hypothetical protein MYK68_16615 [Gordonia sp. PP30]
MSTHTPEHKRTSALKIALVILGILILASIAGALIKAVLWIAVVVLVVVGAITVARFFAKHD